MKPAAIDKGTVEKSISSSGSVAALVTVDVGSQISGQIAELHADFNTTVKKGDLLAVIDPQTYKSRVTSAEADLAVAHATIGTQQANLRKAQTSLDQSRRDLERAKSLADRQLVSVSRHRDGHARMSSWPRATCRSRRRSCKNARAGLQTRQANLDQARIDLSRTQIRSPIDGVVIQRSIDLGQTVAASLQAPVLFKIAQDLSRIQIEAKVDEADIGSIKDNDPATFTVDAFPDQNFQGRVAQVRLASTTVQNVVTYSVMIQANNPRKMLIPGMTANVRIVTDRRDNVLRVPNDARALPARRRGAQCRRAGRRRIPGGGFWRARVAAVARGGGQPRRTSARRWSRSWACPRNSRRSWKRRARNCLRRCASSRPAERRHHRRAGGGFPPGGFPRRGGGFPGGGGGGFNPQNQQGQAMRNRIENMMARILTPEQLEKFSALQQPARRAKHVAAGHVVDAGGRQARGARSATWAWRMTATPKSCRPT